MTGWIKIHRSFLIWEWFDKPEMVQVFVYLLLKANHDAKEWHGMTIERGQIVTSVAKIAQETRLSTQTVRTCINRLKSTNEITSEATSKYTLITISKYDTYQDGEDDANKVTNKVDNNQVTIEQQTTNKELTTNKNEENIRTIRSKEIYTHTEFIDLVKSLTCACASTPEQVEDIAAMVKEICDRVARGAEDAKTYSNFHILTKAYVWHWYRYPELMTMFNESLSYELFLKLTKSYEMDDFKRVVGAMANKLPMDGTRLGSFETTFGIWASQDYQIQEKKRLGNPKYN